MKSSEEIALAVLTTADLSARGINKDAVARAVARGELQRLGYGSYMATSFYSQLYPSQRYLAQVIGFGRGRLKTSVLSHHSAAAVHGMWLLHSPTAIHTVGKAHGIASTRVVRHRLSRYETETSLGVAVTAPLDTVVHCMRVMGFEEALVLADSSLKKVEHQKLTKALREMSGSGSVQGRRLAEMISPLSESPGESLLRLFLLRCGLPAPIEQYEIGVYGNQFRADFAWPELGLIVEFDGQVKYTNFGDREDVFGRQNEREALLRGQGWDVVRVTWEELTRRPHDLKTKLERDFSRARRR
ncbi:hypothetical protein [Rothia nasimurium]|uniref:hypothetical protein n=1 Tax=Rothia nasimurium TaxID=85336 RepID=UPI003BA120E6